MGSSSVLSASVAWLVMPGAPSKLRLAVFLEPRSSRKATSEGSPELQRREQIMREAHSMLPQAKFSKGG